jgi:hypothetical protein
VAAQQIGGSALDHPGDVRLRKRRRAAQATECRGSRRRWRLK